MSKKTEIDLFVSAVLDEHGIVLKEESHVFVLTQYVHNALAHSFIEELSDEKFEEFIDMVGGIDKEQETINIFLKDNVENMDEIVNSVLLKFRDEVTILVKDMPALEEKVSEEDFEKKQKDLLQTLRDLQRRAFSLRMEAQTIVDKQKVKSVLTDIVED